MPWTNPPTEVTGYTVTATDWNNYISANPLYLYGDAGWTNVASFTNSWGASGTAPGYILLGRIVYLRGAMTAGTANTTAFTLPAGYRPTQSAIFFCPEAASGGTQVVNVSTAGAVAPLSSATVWLNAVSFPVV